MHRRKAALGFPVVFAIVGGIEAALSGSVVGVFLGCVYTVGERSSLISKGEGIVPTEN